MSSYFKDPDRHTRGVNAIAAVDGVTARRRQLENRRTQAMNRRDHAMAHMAKQAFSARAAMGAIDIGKLVDAPRAPLVQVTHPPNPKPKYVPPGTGTAFSLGTTVKSPSVVVTTKNPYGTGGGTTPTGLGPATDPPAGGSGSGSAPGLSSGSGHPWGPLPEPTTGTGFGPSIPLTPTAGGSGGGAGTGSPWAGMPTIDVDALQAVSKPVDLAVGGASRNTKLLLLAGLAIGGYLWWRSSQKKG